MSPRLQYINTSDRSSSKYLEQSCSAFSQSLRVVQSIALLKSGARFLGSISTALVQSSRAAFSFLCFSCSLPLSMNSLAVAGSSSATSWQLDWTFLRTFSKFLLRSASEDEVESGASSVGSSKMMVCSLLTRLALRTGSIVWKACLIRVHSSVESIWSSWRTPLARSHISLTLRPVTSLVGVSNAGILTDSSHWRSRSVSDSTNSPNSPSSCCRASSRGRQLRWVLASSICCVNLSNFIRFRQSSCECRFQHSHLEQMNGLAHEGYMHTFTTGQWPFWQHASSNILFNYKRFVCSKLRETRQTFLAKPSFSQQIRQTQTFCFGLKIFFETRFRIRHPLPLPHQMLRVSFTHWLIQERILPERILLINMSERGNKSQEECLEILDEIRSMLKNESAEPNKIVLGIAGFLNSKITLISPEIKNYLGNLLNQSIGIAFNQTEGLFEARTEFTQQLKMWDTAKNIALSLIRFEMLMSQADTKQDFYPKIKDLIQRHRSLIYQTSFRGETIIKLLSDRMMKDELIELIQEIRPNLESKIKGVPLKDYIKKLKNSKEVERVVELITHQQKESSTNLLYSPKTPKESMLPPIIKQKKEITLVNRKNITDIPQKQAIKVKGQNPQKVGLSNIKLKRKAPKLEVEQDSEQDKQSKLQYYQVNNPRKLIPIAYDPNIDPVLKNFLFDASVHDDLRFDDHPEFKFQLKCKNQYFGGKLTLKKQDDRVLNVRLRYKGLPKQKKVKWQFIEIGKNAIVQVPPDWELKKLEKKGSLQIKIEDVDATVFAQELRVQMDGRVVGFLVWTPDWKKSFDEEENDENDDAEDVLTEQSKAQMQIGDHIFENLAIFKNNFDASLNETNYFVIPPNDVQSKDEKCKEYFLNFQKQVIYDMMREQLTSEEKLKPMRAETEVTNQKILIQLQQKLKQLNDNQFKKKMEFSIEKNIVKIHKLVKIDFAQAFLEYLIACISRKLGLQTITTQMSEEDAKELAARHGNKGQVNIKPGEQAGTVQIEANPQIIKEVNKQITEGKVEEQFCDTPLLKRVRTEDPSFDKRYEDLDIDIIDEQKFKVQGPTRLYTKFVKELVDFSRKLLKEEKQQKIALVIQARPQEISEYQEGLKQFFNEGLTIEMKLQQKATKPDQLNKYQVRFPKQLLSMVNERINKIKSQIQKKTMKMDRVSDSAYKLENVSPQLTQYIMARINAELKKIKKEGGISSYVNINPKTSELIINQATKQSTNKFFELLDLIKKSVNIYQSIKSRIAKSKLILVKAELNTIITTEKPKLKSQFQLMSRLKQQYKLLLQAQIDHILQNSHKKLDEQLFKFIQEKDLKNSFFSNKANDVKKQFHSIVQKINFFNTLKERELQNIKKNAPADLDRKTVDQSLGHIKKVIDPLFDCLSTCFKNRALPLVLLDSAFLSFDIHKKTYFGLKLPIIKQLDNFKNVLQANQIVVLKTGTGSGKSTVIPPYLIGMGYNKVLVTQPRRLPCRQIYRRICQTHSREIVGYKVAGQSENHKAKLIYLTDGMLKELIYANHKHLEKVDVLILDEIHERTKSIDLILLLLRKVLIEFPKLKVIFCSATVNSQILNLFHKNIKRQQFSVEISKYPVTSARIPDGVPIFDKVSELYGRLKGGEQLLVFFPGVSEAEQATKLFTQLYKGNVSSLFGNQNSKTQEEAIQNCQVFFSTPVAETSLTFPNLRFVVDSRLSRIMVYDTQLEIMVSRELAASKSSVKQRMGRLGRNCPGEYYYYEYDNPDLAKENDFEFSELDRIDLTNVIFELLMRYPTVQEVIQQLKDLKPADYISFMNKCNYAKKILRMHGMLEKDENTPTQTCINYAMKYKNLSEMRLNIALVEAETNGCFEKVAIVCAFIMMGSNLLDTLLQYIPKDQHSQNGDIETIGKFLLRVADQINIRAIKQENQMVRQVRKHKALGMKPWASTISRIMRQYWRFLVYSNNSGKGTWADVELCLIKAFRNRVYFNMSLLGGSKQLYEKVVVMKQYKQRTLSTVQYIVSFSSILYHRRTQNDIPYFMGIFSTINPYGQCTVSFCQKISIANVEEIITVELIKPVFTFEGVELFNDNAVYDKHHCEMDQGGQMELLMKNYPSFKMRGKAGRIIPRLIKINEELVNPNPVKIDLKAILDKVLQNRINSQKANTTLRRIDEAAVKANFDKLNFRTLFQTIRYELDTYEGATLDTNGGTLEVKNARNSALELVKNKLDGFFKWFVECQTVYSEDHKVPLIQPDRDALGEDLYKEIVGRINQIVDPNIEHYRLKNLSNGKHSKYSARIRRMIAVCWYLVNECECTIKGGFVRDWIVNGKDIIPPGVDLGNLLQKNVRNRFLEVADQRITPSDIDAELPINMVFNPESFTQGMKKLNITVEIEDDGWRKHLLFDKETGGFTADLIQPYCYICHDSYDFDVNVFYIKKDHLSQIGMKIEMVLRPLARNGNLLSFEKQKIHLESLIKSCRNMRMRQIRANVYPYRLDKFRKRGWTIQEECYEPAIHETTDTVAELVGGPREYLRRISPSWFAKMGMSTVIQVYALSNSNWNSAYQAALKWISSETDNVNDRLLYHGTDEAAAQSIKKYGFDSRYYNNHGNYGRGVYFADDPAKSHTYTKVNPNGERFMFIVRVALGQQEVLSATNVNRTGPNKGFHSIFGRTDANEYIVQRWDQAKPICLIIYK